MDILTKIVAAKKIELSIKKAHIPLSQLEAIVTTETRTSLAKSLFENKPGIISEFKRRSPSKPTINLDASISKIIKAYTDNGTAGISVLTNEEFFGGSIQDLKNAAALTNKPILRKEFIIDTYQILEAKIHGASAILLIAEILSAAEIETLSSFANSLGLEVLLELHSESEIHKISDKISIIGINNRNLKTFNTDIKYSIDIYDKLPQDLPKISESGLSNVEDIIRLRDVGYNGFLIGEYLMLQSNPGLALKNLISKIN